MTRRQEDGLISVTVSDGKYTIQQIEPGKWEALRYGEEWPAYRDSGPDNLHVALAYEVAALRKDLTEKGRERIGDSEKCGAALCRAEKAEARIVELEMAMVPFVAMADSWCDEEADSTMMDFHEEGGAHINLGHCRKARAAYYGEAA